MIKTHLDNKTYFLGDRQRIKQLMVILVDNALNYMGIPGTIDISLTRDVKNIILTVSDTGNGIEPEHLDKIFDRFYRVTSTRNQNKDGSGLGLSVAKWIVQEHGGVIRVESEPGTGTIFTILFPDLL